MTVVKIATPAGIQYMDSQQEVVVRLPDGTFFVKTARELNGGEQILWHRDKVDPNISFDEVRKALEKSLEYKQALGQVFEKVEDEEGEHLVTQLRTTLARGLLGAADGSVAADLEDRIVGRNGLDLTNEEKHIIGDPAAVVTGRHPTTTRNWVGGCDAHWYVGGPYAPREVVDFESLILLEGNEPFRDAISQMAETREGGFLYSVSFLRTIHQQAGKVLHRNGSLGGTSNGSGDEPEPDWKYGDKLAHVLSLFGQELEEDPEIITTTVNGAEILKVKLKRTPGPFTGSVEKVDIDYLHATEMKHEEEIDKTEAIYTATIDDIFCGAILNNERWRRMMPSSLMKSNAIEGVMGRYFNFDHISSPDIIGMKKKWDKIAEALGGEASVTQKCVEDEIVDSIASGSFDKIVDLPRYTMLRLIEKKKEYMLALPRSTREHAVLKNFAGILIQFESSMMGPDFAIDYDSPRGLALKKTGYFELSKAIYEAEKKRKGVLFVDCFVDIIQSIRSYVGMIESSDENCDWERMWSSPTEEEVHDRYFHSPPYKRVTNSMIADQLHADGFECVIPLLNPAREYVESEVFNPVVEALQRPYSSNGGNCSPKAAQEGGKLHNTIRDHYADHPEEIVPGSVTIATESRTAGGRPVDILLFSERDNTVYVVEVKSSTRNGVEQEPQAVKGYNQTCENLLGIMRKLRIDGVEDLPEIKGIVVSASDAAPWDGRTMSYTDDNILYQSVPIELLEELKTTIS